MPASFILRLIRCHRFFVRLLAPHHDRVSCDRGAIIACQLVGNAILHFELMAELLRIQAVVMSALAQEFGMRALLGDLSILDDQNTIRSADGGKTMGN